jgi:hypothetical protein
VLLSLHFKVVIYKNKILKIKNKKTNNVDLIKAMCEVKLNLIKFN